MAAMPLAKAISAWEATSGESAAEAKEIKIMGGVPQDDGKKRVFITRLDATLGSLANCERLSLSTNLIDKMFALTGMSNLKILSLARNRLKRIEKLEDVADTLEQLWLSYNEISSLDGLQGMNKLEVLYMSNNSIKEWSELDKLAELESLREVLFIGNDIYDGLEPEMARLMVVKHLPNITKVDAVLIKDDDRQRAAEL